MSERELQRLKAESVMRLDGQFVCRTFEGSTAKDRFLGYLSEDLLPCLKKGDIVIMDNLRAHHTKGVEKIDSLCRLFFILKRYAPAPAAISLSSPS